MKIKPLIVSIVSIVIIFATLLAISVFTRYRQIITINSYEKCDNSLGRYIVIIGERTCITLDGRKFDYDTVEVVNGPDLKVVLEPHRPVLNTIPSIFVYIAHHGPISLYKQIISKINTVADYMLLTYFR